MSIKRYTVTGTCGGQCHEIEEDAHGEFVTFADFDSLRLTLRNLCDAAGQWTDHSEALKMAHFVARYKLNETETGSVF